MNALRHQAQGLVVLGLGLASTSSALAVLHTAAATTPAVWETTLLIGANLVATLLRLLLFRAWVFRAG